MQHVNIAPTKGKSDERQLTPRARRLARDRWVCRSARSTWLVSGAAMISLLAHTPIQACKFKPSSMQANIAAADVVFVGVVEAPSNDRSGREEPRAAVLRVTKALKGGGLPESIKTVATSGSSCGLAFAVGQEWLVVASFGRYGSNNRDLQADIPGGSVLLQDQAARDYVQRELGISLPTPGKH